ncbi:MAG: hydrogenase formation protein HypD [Candidatus Njordarchaeia archaeon]
MNSFEANKKFFSDFRDKKTAKAISEKIEKVAGSLKNTMDEKINIMHVCGTHEHTITFYGIRNILPENIELIAGPGCPVCVVPAEDIDNAISLALDGIPIYTFGDMVRVPGSKSSLYKARAEGGDIRVVYGFHDAIKDFTNRGEKEAVFFAAGFETTAPTFAAPIAEGKVPHGLSLLTAFRITVPITRYVLSLPQHKIHGVIAPGHVSVITGASAWSFLPRESNIPVVIAGFEPIDVLLAIYHILKMIHDSKAEIVNEYKRIVTWDGNVVAKKYLEKAFNVTTGRWRGIGDIKDSAWILKERFSSFDTRVKYNLKQEKSIEMPPACRCADVILGLAKPTDCPLFGSACTPSSPIGPCMVSSEGTCSIWYKYGGYQTFKRNS